MTEDTKSTLGLIVGLAGFLLALWTGYRDAIKLQYHARNRKMLKGLIEEMEAPDYAEKFRHTRDRFALMGFAFLAADGFLEALRFTAWYPVTKKPMLAYVTVAQLFGAYIAVLWFIAALGAHRSTATAYINRRLVKLKKAYARYSNSSPYNPDAAK